MSRLTTEVSPLNIASPMTPNKGSVKFTAKIFEESGNFGMTEDIYESRKNLHESEKTEGTVSMSNSESNFR